MQVLVRGLRKAALLSIAKIKDIAVRVSKDEKLVIYRVISLWWLAVMSDGERGGEGGERRRERESEGEMRG